MRLIINTDAYTALKVGHESVLKLLENADTVIIPAIVLGELYSGFFMGTQTTRDLVELDEFLAKPGVHIVSVDKPIAERYGLLIKILRFQGTALSANKIWIASIVLETGSKLVSMDRQFETVPGIIRIPF